MAKIMELSVCVCFTHQMELYSILIFQSYLQVAELLCA